jgi:hypothetical protein
LEANIPARNIIFELSVITKLLQEEAKFLHIGSDLVITLKKCNTYLDIETTTLSKDSREFLKTVKRKDY